MVPALRVGFVLDENGFAAVLYTRVLSDATKRSPWFASSADAMAHGIAWADRLGVPADIVRVDVKLLGGPQTAPGQTGGDRGR